MASSVAGGRCFVEQNLPARIPNSPRRKSQVAMLYLQLLHNDGDTTITLAGKGRVRLIKDNPEDFRICDNWKPSNVVKCSFKED
eukprot:scaffold17186_cov124-Skeletonema_menzelii.AAC.3